MVTNVQQKRIALIGYNPAGYFVSLGKALEDSGFEVFWAHITRGATKEHEALGCTAPTNILDTTEGFVPDLSSVERHKKELSELESAENPRINDIILMDRILRHKSHAFALCYLNHLQRVLSKFFTDNSISLVSSGKDSALQLMSMLVCRRLGIPWVVPTRVRIPQDMYMFASGHETASTLDFRATTNEDRAWAEDFLASFKLGRDKPAMKVAAKSLIDTFKMMPRHARVFATRLRMSFAERGNDYSRYKISRIMWMYVRRRLNMVMFKVYRPYAKVGERPFCLYALHTQPESSIDVEGSYFSDQVALISFIARSVPISHDLYVKIHPTDLDGQSILFYRRISRLPGVRVIHDAGSRDLVRRASIVFTLTGTIGYEAALMGKTVVTFARNFYNQMPTVHHCKSPATLPALIDSLLSTRQRDDEIRERLISFLANVKAKSFFGEFNRMYLPQQDPLTVDDLKTLQVAYNQVYDVLQPRRGFPADVSASGLPVCSQTV